MLVQFQPQASAGAKAGFSNYGATTVDIGAPAALYASTHFGATAAQIKAAILAAATPTASLAGRTVTGGRLNVSGF